MDRPRKTEREITGRGSQISRKGKKDKERDPETPDRWTEREKD